MGGNVQDQWMAIKTAPLLYAAAIIAVALLAWAIIHFLYRHRLEGLKEELERERRENERLKAAARPSAIPAPVPASTQERKQSVAPAHQKAVPGVGGPRPSSRQKPLPEADRVYLGSNVTGAYLRAFFKGRTQHQGEQAIQPYIGKWMRAEGAIRNIWPKPQNWQVAIVNTGRDEIVGSIMITCLSSETPKLEVLGKGDVIKIEGRITKIDERWINLDQGRIRDNDAG